jgi:hypothetical protein
VRLPFRHTGKPDFITEIRKVKIENDVGATSGATIMSMTNEVKANTPVQTERQSHEASFAKVQDGRKQPIRGLWKRRELSERLSLDGDGMVFGGLAWGIVF